MTYKRIELLSKNVINKIIECLIIKDPSYIVKELMENSCDAKSKNITVYIENDGFDLIKVIDDGCGIYKDDLYKACEKYSTSKIKYISDLEKINTYGFKGESLNFIKNISIITIKSKPFDQNEAYKITFYNDNKYIIEKCSGTNGTEITIQNLNFDKKFKTKNNILFYQKIIALSNFDIHFKFYKNSKEIKNLPPCYTKIAIAQRIEELIGKNSLKNSFDIQYEKYEKKINGFLCEKKKQTFNFIFINNRFIKNEWLKNLINNLIKKNLKINLKINYCLYFYLSQKIFFITNAYSKTNITFYNKKEINEFLEEAIKNFLNKMLYIKEKDLNINIKKNEKNYILLNKNLTENIEYKTENKILTILENNLLIFELNKKVYITNLNNLKIKILIKNCINQIQNLNKIISKNLEDIYMIDCEIIDKIVSYKNILKIYGFEIENFFNEKIIIKSIPDILFNLKVDWKNLIKDIINFLDKNISTFFSINRFDINIINIFIKNIHSNNKCYKFEIEQLYNELSFSYINNEQWFKKNCFEISYKKILKL